MIIDIDNYCRNWLVKVKRNIIESILLANQNILDKMRLEVFIVDSNINLLLSESIFPPQVIGLLDLKLVHFTIFSPFNHRLKNIDTA